MSWLKVIALGTTAVFGCGIVGYSAGRAWSKEDRESLEESPEAHEWSLEEDENGTHIVERKKKNGKTYSRRF